ncbi:ABC transporter substrate-binding protein [Roseateles asaccharophilus]|uniref:ABC-type branched-subunit amino acid transport system substrate-binding protein n=1 Tax=Roseateles asaccharophilus TaxID=582607 RepID=A0ABU2A8Z2_9BURK|nr:ABC transporter substrate-binding protein [Roseateles asaccharophilus]MDR7333647.1 ABC-type branched-subunit amino acid transport system substrate-binding protein [Roseateles asaccharophilus]
MPRIALALLLLFATLLARAQAPILLGTSAPFSGAFAEYGQEYRKGADACLARINAAGGVRGRPVRIDYLDDAYDPTRTQANARELHRRGAVAFVNLVGTGSLLALAPVLDELKTPVFGVSSGAAQLREDKPGQRWIFHTKASYADEFQGFARLLPTIGMTRLALVYQDNAFGRAGLASAMAAMPSQPEPIVLGQGTDALARAVQQARAAEPHAVLLIAAGAQAPEFIQAYRASAGTSARVAVLSVVGGRLLTDKLGEQVAGIMTSLVYPNPWSPGRRASREYQTAMQPTGQPLSLLGLEGCLNLRFAVEALKLASPDANGAALRQAAERGIHLDLGDFQLRLNPGSRSASRYTSLGIYRASGRISE